MMYMPDAIRATLELMDVPENKISIRTSYNISGVSFSPSEIYKEIKTHIPEFDIEYQPDNKEKIAMSWPRSIDDNAAQSDWGWQPVYALEGLVEDMIQNLQIKEKVC